MRLRTALLSVLFAVSCWAASQPPATEADVAALEVKAWAGESQSIRQLFELLSRSDGAVTEAIQISLGKVINGHPRAFLEGLKKSGITPGSPLFGGLLGNLGEPFVDDFKGQVKELKRRRTAFLAVNDDSLSDVRDWCLGELRLDIEERNRAVKEVQRQLQ